jgi:hypothetical protein
MMTDAREDARELARRIEKQIDKYRDAVMVGITHQDADEAATLLITQAEEIETRSVLMERMANALKIGLEFYGNQDAMFSDGEAETLDNMEQELAGYDHFRRARKELDGK